jgi:hypothetical protein
MQHYANWSGVIVGYGRYKLTYKVLKSARYDGPKVFLSALDAKTCKWILH